MRVVLIECKDVTVKLGKRVILSDINLSIKAGEIVTVIGPNGSGKTTLFKTLIGALKPSTGSIKKAEKLRIGYVPQKLHIDETLPMTVKRFINLPTKHSSNEIKEALSLAGADGLEQEQMLDLSGGQLQRILLAHALLDKPDLLLLDEATQGLDRRGSTEFYRHIAQVRKSQGCAIMLISHELHVVMKEADRVICLNGRICCQGEPQVVSNSDQYHALFGVDEETASAIYVHKQHAHLEELENV